MHVRGSNERRLWSWNKGDVFEVAEWKPLDGSTVYNKLVKLNGDWCQFYNTRFVVVADEQSAVGALEEGTKMHVDFESYDPMTREPIVKIELDYNQFVINDVNNKIPMNKEVMQAAVNEINKKATDAYNTALASKAAMIASQQKQLADYTQMYTKQIEAYQLEARNLKLVLVTIEDVYGKDAVATSAA